MKKGRKKERVECTVWDATHGLGKRRGTHTFGILAKEGEKEKGGDRAIFNKNELKILGRIDQRSATNEKQISILSRVGGGGKARIVKWEENVTEGGKERKISGVCRGGAKKRLGETIEGLNKEIGRGGKGKERGTLFVKICVKRKKGGRKRARGYSYRFETEEGEKKLVT